MTVTKVFYGREDRIGEFNDEIERVDYVDMNEDLKRIGTAADSFFDTVTDLEEKVADYMEAHEVDEELANTDKAREALVEEWAMTQATLSKLAWVLRIDGNEAYHRLIDTIKGNGNIDMSGL